MTTLTPPDSNEPEKTSSDYFNEYLNYLGTEDYLDYFPNGADEFYNPELDNQTTLLPVDDSDVLRPPSTEDLEKRSNRLTNSLDEFEKLINEINQEIENMTQSPQEFKQRKPEPTDETIEKLQNLIETEHEEFEFQNNIRLVCYFLVLVLTYLNSTWSIVFLVFAFQLYISLQSLNLLKENEVFFIQMFQETGSKNEFIDNLHQIRELDSETKPWFYLFTAIVVNSVRLGALVLAALPNLIGIPFLQLYLVFAISDYPEKFKVPFLGLPL